MFQSNIIDPLKAIDEINFLKKSINDRIFDKNGSIKEKLQMDFGFKFDAKKVSEYCLEK